MILLAAAALVAWIAYSPDTQLLIKRLSGYQHLLSWWTNLRSPPLSPAEAGDQGPASSLVLHNAGDLAEDSAGNVYVSDRRGYVWRVDGSGTVHIVAGTGRRGVIRPGTPALVSALGSPEGLALDSEDRLYFADSFNHSVFRIESDGTMARIAGTGFPGHRGDGGAATQASLRHPYDICFDALGDLYVADVGNHRIRKVTSTGVIEPVAGTGKRGYAGDGGAAVAAALDSPYGIALDPEGRLLIADSGNHVVRRVDADGIITTIGGTGQPGYAGDGGNARRALLDSPQFLAVDDSGRIYVGDEHNHAVRVIEADGTIGPLVGDGVPGSAPDTIPVSEARLNDPEQLLIRRDGSILIADGDNHSIRVLASNGMVGIFAGKRGGPSE